VYWETQNEPDVDDFDVDTEYYYNERGGEDEALYGRSQKAHPKPSIALEKM